MNIILIIMTILFLLGFIGVTSIWLTTKTKTRKEIENLSAQKYALEQRFSGILDLDAEKEKIRKDLNTEKEKAEKNIAELQAEYKRENANYIKRKEQYKREFTRADDLIKKMKKEIATLEETLEILDYGLYTPSFDFQTSEEYKDKIKELHQKSKDLIKQKRAVICTIEWSVGGSKVEGRKMTRQNHKLMLRAFNGECDAALSKVKWNNVKKMEERIKKSYEAINKTGEVNKSHITKNYLEVKLQQLYATHEYQEKLQEEKEEQRRIREEMREEEKARKEMEKQQRDAEKEELRYEKALEKAKEELSKASEGKVEALNEKLRKLQEQLEEAQRNKERAISQAQLTKSGHVYIISNIGSFGKDIFKIGMTRRLEPMDRVKELGDASVPFSFDVHAMIYSENAPEVENMLHKHFEEKKLNLINNRKEFFNITINDIETLAKDKELNFQLTKVAEAKEYYESMAIRNQKNNKPVEPEEKFPEFSLQGVFSE